MIMLFLRLCLFLLSFLGYVLHVDKKGIHPAFAPVICVSGIGLVMFVTGILNFMPIAVCVIFAGGLLLVYKNRDVFVKPSPPRGHLLPICFFLAVTLLFAIRLANALPTHYDNFSHWLLVVRDMLNNNRLPNFQSELVTFQGYPTGSAGFIYYVCRIIGDSEGAMLIGQGVVLVSCITVFLAFVKKFSIRNCLLILLVNIYLLCANTVITDLLVDTLLSFLAVAQFAVLLYYREDWKKSCLCSCIIGCFLVTVKNSGVFFVILHSLFPLFLHLCRTRGKLMDFLRGKENRLALQINLLAPAILIFLWNRHVKLVFKHGLGSKHSMTPQIFYHAMREKGISGFWEVSGIFLRRIATPGAELLVLIILAAMALLLVAGLKKRQKNLLPPTELVGWGLVTYVCYLAGMLAMYLFSMSYWEALGLGGFDRYLATITMYLAGIAVAYFLMMEPLSPSWVRTAMPALMCALILTTYDTLPYLFSGSGSIRYGDSIRRALIQIDSRHDIPDGSRCYLVAEDGNGYIDFLSRYTFWSDHTSVRTTFSAEDFPTIVSEYDYMILLDPPAELAAVLEQCGLPAGEEVYSLAQYR